MLSVLSGYLGENEEPSLWLWNLVPTQAHMPGSDISKKTAEHPMICWVCLSSLSGKISPSIGQGTRFKPVTYEGALVRISNAGPCRLF